MCTLNALNSADSGVGRSRSGAQITQFGTTLAGRLGDQIADHIGGYSRVAGRINGHTM
jgi:hypothetical protein